MNADKFEKLCRELLDKAEGTLFWKSKEYATDEDRLANFRQPTSMLGISPAEVCLMYQMKHIASISKIAKETSQGELPTKELLQEKCQDVLNYTLIFYAIVSEMIEKAQAASTPQIALNSDPESLISLHSERDLTYGPTLDDTRSYGLDTNSRDGE